MSTQKSGNPHATHHWLHQRITAVANLGLMIWLVWSVTHVGVVDHATFTAWLAQPVNAGLMTLAVLSTFYHAVLGIQVITEDYVHCDVLKASILIGVRLFFVAAGAACVLSIVKIAFAG